MKQAFCAVQSEDEAQPGSSMDVETTHEPSQASSPTLKVKNQNAYPPIFLKTVHTWTLTPTDIHKAVINIKEYRTSADNIRVMPTTSDDYKLSLRLLDQLKLELVSYRLAEVRLLLVLIKGLPRNYSSEELKIELSFQGFPVISTTWMNYTRTYAVVSLERMDEAKKFTVWENALCLQSKLTRNIWTHVLFYVPIARTSDIPGRPVSYLQHVSAP